MAHTSHVCPYPLLCDIPAASSRLSCADRPVARLLQDQHVEGKTRGKQGVCEQKGILRTKAVLGPTGGHVSTGHTPVTGASLRWWERV